jgi:hypothetical protein
MPRQAIEELLEFVVGEREVGGASISGSSVDKNYYRINDGMG